MAKGKKLVDLMMSGVKTPAQMKMEMAVDRARAPQDPVLSTAGQNALKLGQSDNRQTRSLQQGYEHGWYHGGTGDITSFDPNLLGESTGAASAKQGFFFARDPQNPPEHLTKKTDDPASIEMLRRAGVDVDNLNKVSFEGHGADTASGYARMGGDREYKEAMRQAKAAEKRGDWNAYEKHMADAEDYEVGRMNEAQRSVAKYGEARDTMLDRIGQAFYRPMEGKNQFELEAFDKEYQQLFPYGWYSKASPEDFKRYKELAVARLGEEGAAPVLDAMKAFESARNDRAFYENMQSGANVMPVALRYKDPLVHDFAGSTYRDETYNDLLRRAREEGKDAVLLKNTYDPGAGPSKLVDVGVVFDPSQIRSKFAAFDPDQIDSPDILKAQGGIIKMSKGGVGRKLADKILPKVEAPSVMTRSEISELADYIKNREGGYGLRRVERAADEIPRLGEMYTQDALRSAFSGDNARALMTMNPADFEKYAAPIDPYFLKGKAYRSSGDDKMGHEDYIKHLEDIQARGGFKDVPFFEINKEEQGLPLLPFISGHEGRHRSRAMTAAGENAGLVQLLPRSELREPFPRRSQEDYIEALKREMAITGNKVLPQTYTEPKPNSFDDTVIRRPAIDLPDFYAKGGAVKMAEGGEADQAEIDRMRLELNNSPVIQATPQSPFQRGIGTLGGYMDQAGQFVSKALEPIAETHPVKHFLGEMLLADTLKSAGTALQDYTKTSRDYTEDNPYKRAPITGSGQTMSLDPRMLDVIGFADPVTRLGIKAGRAGAKAATPFAKDAAEMASELYMKGDIPGMISPNMYAVSPDGKPSKVLAPANEIGFYSPTEAAALNLQRKSGAGQAFLNDIMKGENVRADEISAMGLDTFLKDKKNVTADEVRDYIAQNKIQLGETRYGKLNDQQMMAEWNKIAMKDYGKPYNELDHNEAVSVERYADQDTSKFSDYALPGGENYREIVLTLPEPAPRAKTVDEAFELWKQDARAGKRGQYSPEEIDSMQPDNILDILKDEYMTPSKKGVYKSSHWDEPNPLAHLRVSDRVTDGKKTLLVDEVQSDWHQAGREHGYSNPEQRADIVRMMADEIELTPEQEQLRRAYLKGKLVPDAPYKDDWYQLTLRRAIKEAIDGGYDRVALPTGSRVAERFDLSKQIDRIDYNKNDDGTYSMSAIKDGREVFAKEGLDEKELSGIVGKDVAKKIVGDEGSSAPKADRWEAEDGDVPEFKSLSGLDLSVGGEGMKKYYDEIYPGYLKKFGKKYGAEVGDTKLLLPIPKMNKPTGWGGDQYMKGEISLEEYLKLNPDIAKNYTETLHYMDITPAMRKEFSTGIPMKRGGKVSFAHDIDAMRLELSKG
jgi:hypothetical protein